MNELFIYSWSDTSAAGGAFVFTFGHADTRMIPVSIFFPSFYTV